VGIYYVGKLQSGSVFDSHKVGRPYPVKMGKGNVISGLEMGLVGMTVGGRRILTIPAELGYGKRGVPPTIPKNAVLIFDVRVVSVE